jgi:hypothetical protein
MPAMRLVVPGSAGRPLRTATHRTRRRGELVRIHHLMRHVRMAAAHAVCWMSERSSAASEHARNGPSVANDVRVLPTHVH